MYLYLYLYLYLYIQIVCRDEWWYCAILYLLLAPPHASAPCPRVRKVTADYDDGDDDDDNDGDDGGDDDDDYQVNDVFPLYPFLCWPIS